MRHLVFTLVFSILLSGAFAQKSAVTTAANNIGTPDSPGNLKKAKESIDQAETNAETSGMAKTFYVKGKVYQGIAEDMSGLYASLDAKAAQVSFVAYLKAIELSKTAAKKKDDYRADIAMQLPNLRRDLLGLGSKGFNDKDYALSVQTFEQSLTIDSLLPQLDSKQKFANDTLVLYYTGLAAYNAKMYDKSISYLKKAQALKFGVNVKDSTGTNSKQAADLVQVLYDVYRAKGDTLAGIEELKKAMLDLPSDNKDVILNLAQYYLQKGNASDAIAYLDKAIQLDPSNANLYYVKGVLYDNLKDFDNSLTSYKMAIDKNPNYFDANYNVGALYYNRYAQIFNDANNIPQNQAKKYEAEVERAKEQLRLALPYFEKAHEISPDDNDCMRSLSSVYIKLDMLDNDNYKKLKDKMNKGN